MAGTSSIGRVRRAILQVAKTPYNFAIVRRRNPVEM